MNVPDPPAPSLCPPDPACRRILIVDDDTALLEALSTALAAHYRVVTARSGAEALEKIGQHLLDLVLLDYSLPDISGLVILQTIKGYFPSVPVILITGFGSEEVSVEAFRRGVRDYVTKPINLSDLEARIEQAFTVRRRAGEIRVPDRRAGTRSLETDGDPPTDLGLRRALAFIKASLNTHLSLEQVAREAGMSKFRFCRHFRSLMGLSFREFLARQRVERASLLLQDPKRTVTEVYLEVGFKDLSHFGRVFRRITGQPPSRFRRTSLNRPSSAIPNWCLPGLPADLRGKEKQE